MAKFKTTTTNDSEEIIDIIPRKRKEKKGISGKVLFIYMDKEHKCVRRIEPHPEYFEGEWHQLVMALTESTEKQKNYHRYEIK